MAHVQRTGRTEVVVAASPDAVWQVISDVTRTGEWSHECGGVHWLDRATAAAPGVRFRARNRAGAVRWGRISEFVTVDAPHELAWQTVPTRLYPDSTVWRFRLESVPEGTRIVQEFDVVRTTWMEPVYAVIVPRHRDRRDRLRADLERIGEVASRVGVERARVEPGK
jgi:hypothetical protein